ncbi:MAG: hypothetical protein IKN89_02330 [Oscillospiraceae bacterium]|nr:hypothetical protein [Oscillospiraceae bacterium]
MMMTDAEIIREYREAKTPLKQIGILADENQCSRGKIVDILRAAGVDLPAVYREKARTEERPAGAQAPSVSFADSSLPEGAKDGDASGDEEAAYGPILPAPRLAGFSERVNDGAVEVIARMVADSDSAGDQQEARWSFLERVRGVLALVHELRGGYGE